MHRVARAHGLTAWLVHWAHLGSMNSIQNTVLSGSRCQGISRVGCVGYNITCAHAPVYVYDTDSGIQRRTKSEEVSYVMVLGSKAIMLRIDSAGCSEHGSAGFPPNDNSWLGSFVTKALVIPAYRLNCFPILYTAGRIRILARWGVVAVLADIVSDQRSCTLPDLYSVAACYCGNSFASCS